jgi:hypothetical protein
MQKLLIVIFSLFYTMRLFGIPAYQKQEGDGSIFRCRQSYRNRFIAVWEKIIHLQ